MRNTTALLPVGTCFFDSRKLDLAQIASVWGPCTVQVMTVEKAHGAKPKLRFVVGCGTGGYNKSFTAHHDQTGARLGDYTQINEIHLAADGTITYKENELHVEDKAAVHVYK